MKEIVVVSSFQRDRLIQFEEGVHNVNNVERLMAKEGTTIMFAGDVDHEVQLDASVIKAVKYGLAAIYRELKEERLEDVAREIIEINAQ